MKRALSLGCVVETIAAKEARSGISLLKKIPRLFTER